MIKIGVTYSQYIVAIIEVLQVRVRLFRRAGTEGDLHVEGSVPVFVAAYSLSPNYLRHAASGRPVGRWANH